MTGAPRRVLFVFAWFVVGGEETEVRLLAKHLDRSRYRIEVAACFRLPNMPEQGYHQLAALGVPVDRTLEPLDDDATVARLAEKLASCDLVVACQGVRDVYPALERLRRPPPLIEHGGLVAEATANPKHLTARYVGVCQSIHAAAARAMPERPHHAIEIPSMVDLEDFHPSHRADVRRELGVGPGTPVVGWVGRLDRKKRVEDVLSAVALVRRSHPALRLVLVGGPDAFMPEYAAELRALAAELGLEHAVLFLGDRPDVPRLMSGFDALLWLSQGEGMPHVLAEAGAAGLPVVATRDNGSGQQIEDGATGLFVSHLDPAAAAAALDRLLGDNALRRTLGCNLRRRVEREYAAPVVTRRWEALFDEVLEEHQVLQPAG